MYNKIHYLLPLDTKHVGCASDQQSVAHILDLECCSSRAVLRADVRLGILTTAIDCEVDTSHSLMVLSRDPEARM